MLAWVVASLALHSVLQLSFTPKAVNGISLLGFSRRESKIAPKVFIIDMVGRISRSTVTSLTIACIVR